MFFSDCISNNDDDVLNNITVVCKNLTIETPEVWAYPESVRIVSLVVLVINALSSLILNSLLFLVLQNSPSLKTPPNSHLMNICVNNILLCFAMVIAAVAINISSVLDDYNGRKKNIGKVLTGIQMFLVYNSLIQYWGTFACIGYYRLKTIRVPDLTLRMRRQLVSWSISGNWIVSLFLSLGCCVSYSDDMMILQVTLDPFRAEYLSSVTVYYSVEQIIVIMLVLLVFICGFVTIFISYYNIIKTLNIPGTFAKNRVTPWHRAQSLASDVADLTVPSGRSYDLGNTGRLFTVSQKENDTLVVHYQKCDHAVVFEDILALENSIDAGKNNPSQQVRITLSNGSAQSQCPDFTDISTSAELERCQQMKNYSALRNHYFRRDQGSLSSATRNSLVMFCAYLACSFPLIICSIPCALSSISPTNRVKTLLACRLLFYLNAPIYPAWYLLFSKRVRKCLRRIVDSVLLHMNFRA